MRILNPFVIALVSLGIIVSIGTTVIPERLGDQCKACITDTCTNKRLLFNAKKTYCCQPEVMEYAGKEIDCNRHDGDVDGLCYQHGVDWDICVDLMRSKFCKKECSKDPIPQDIFISIDNYINEDIFHRVNRTKHYD